MKTIKFKKNCIYRGKEYAVGSELKKFTKDDINSIINLNEKGFIEPLKLEELKAIADGSFFNSKKEEK